MEPLVGFEPTTCSLRMSCSTPELQRLMTFSQVWCSYVALSVLRFVAGEFLFTRLADASRNSPFGRFEVAKGCVFGAIQAGASPFGLPSQEPLSRPPSSNGRGSSCRDHLQAGDWAFLTGGKRTLAETSGFHSGGSFRKSSMRTFRQENPPNTRPFLPRASRNPLRVTAQYFRLHRRQSSGVIRKAVADPSDGFGQAQRQARADQRCVTGIRDLFAVIVEYDG